MINFKTMFAALALVAGFAGATSAQEHGGGVSIEKQPWTFAGVFGTYDENQLQRGFQIFKEVCSSCHSADLIAFRNLAEPGGPGFTAGQVKALAAEYNVIDADTGAERPATPADRWPAPFANHQDARDANGGALPPDFSVLAKARGNSTIPFPWWILNYFTAYSEGGPDYIHALLNGYHEEVPEGFELADGKYYNDVFPGHAISMAPPLSDGAIEYEATEGGAVPLTLEQYSTDVSAFMMWMAEPHLVARKEAGFRVILFLILFAGLMYFTKKRIWKGIEH